MRYNIFLVRSLILVLLLLILPYSGEAKPKWVDKPLASDPKENATPCDWLEFHAVAEESALKIAYRCASPVNFSLGAAYSVYLDTDGRRDTGYRGSDDHFPIGADYLLQGATLYRYGGHYAEKSGVSWSWTSLGLVTYDVSDDWAEFTLAKELFSASSDTINVILVGDNTAIDVGGNYTDEFPDSALRKSGSGRSIQIRYKDAAQ